MQLLRQPDVQKLAAKLHYADQWAASIEVQISALQACTTLLISQLSFAQPAHVPVLCFPCASDVSAAQMLDHASVQWRSVQKWLQCRTAGQPR